MKIVTQHNFHIDGWEEVWEYEKTGKNRVPHIFEALGWCKIDD